MSDNETCSNKIVMVHICWTLAILILIIVLLLTCGLKNLPEGSVLIDAITNFSTILSIILSISSILFAYYTSRDTSMQYRSMEKALEEVRGRIEWSINVGIPVNLKDLAEHFTKAPYGWGIMSVNGLVAELWNYKIIFISSSIKLHFIKLIRIWSKNNKIKLFSSFLTYIVIYFFTKSIFISILF